MWELGKELGGSKNEDLDKSWANEEDDDWDVADARANSRSSTRRALEDSPPSEASRDTTPRSAGGLGGALSGAFLTALRYSWRSPTATPAPEAEPAVQPPAYSVDQLERLLLWEEPWATGRSMLIGAYLLICMQAVLSGSLPIQLTTAFSLAALGSLLYNMGRRLLSQGRAVFATAPGAAAWGEEGVGAQHAQQQATEEDEVESNSGGVLLQVPQHISEAWMQKQVHDSLTRMVNTAAPYIAAALSLGSRLLSVGGHMGSSVWLALALWVVMVLGELQLVGQGKLAVCCWLGAFSLPWLYVQCKRALDGLVEEAAAAVAAAARSGNRGWLVAAAGAVLAVLVACGSLAMYLKLPLAMASGAGVLTWRLHARATAAAAKAAAAA